MARFTYIASLINLRVSDITSQSLCRREKKLLQGWASNFILPPIFQKWTVLGASYLQTGNLPTWFMPGRLGKMCGSFAKNCAGFAVSISSFTWRTTKRSSLKQICALNFPRLRRFRKYLPTFLTRLGIDSFWEKPLASP